jgi:hypothetical protein
LNPSEIIVAAGINGEAKRSQRNRSEMESGDLEREREKEGKGWMFTVHGSSKKWTYGW